MTMPNLLHVAIDLAPNPTDLSVQRLDSYLSLVLGPAINELLTGPCTEIAKTHRHESEETEIYVVHYTSLQTLHSIIAKQIMWNRRDSELARSSEDGVGQLEPLQPTGTETELGPCFRLYDSAHVNDPQEGGYFTRHLPERHRWLQEYDTHRAYIASFILPRTTIDDAADNLVFWRTYGREGEGCSISLAIPRAKLRQVKYGADAVQASCTLLLPALNELRPLLEWGDRLDIDARSHFRTELAHMVWTSLGPIRYLYKSNAYKYEREYRVVLAQSNNDTNQNPVSFRFQSTGRGGRIRHFVEDSDLLMENLFSSDTAIYIGPCCRNRIDLMRSIETLLKRADLSAPVKSSGIKYRQVV